MLTLCSYYQRVSNLVEPISSLLSLVRASLCLSTWTRDRLSGQIYSNEIRACLEDRSVLFCCLRYLMTCSKFQNIVIWQKGFCHKRQWERITVKKRDRWADDLELIGKRWEKFRISVFLGSTKLLHKVWSYQIENPSPSKRVNVWGFLLKLSFSLVLRRSAHENLWIFHTVMAS